MLRCTYEITGRPWPPRNTPRISPQISAHPVADLAQRTPYDEVVKALGGAGETVTDPQEIGPALDRAYASGVPYLVNVITDVEAAYPRNTFGI